MVRVSCRMSTNTGVAPRSTKAFAVETKVKEGRMTSSPGPTPTSSAAISNAPVQEWVRRACRVPVISTSSRWQRALKGPLPPVHPPSSASSTSAASAPVR